MKLHPIKHDLPGTLWCGPAALSATCGVPTSLVHRIIQEFRGDHRRPVKGISNHELNFTAKFFGFHLETVYDYWADRSLAPRPKPTLAAFTRNFRPFYQEHPVIVCVTGHYVVVHKRTFVDNQVNPTGVPLKRAPHRRARVKKAWRVVPIAGQTAATVQ